MSESTLRDVIIEEIAPVLHANDPAYSPPYWDDCTDDMKRWYRDQAAAALDAILDALMAYKAGWSQLSSLVAVLRDDAAKSEIEAIRNQATTTGPVSGGFIPDHPRVIPECELCGSTRPHFHRDTLDGEERVWT